MRTSCRYLARVVQAIPPKTSALARSPVPVASTSTASSPLSDEPTLIHKIAEDLKISVKDSIAMDDPTKYVYQVQVLEEEKQPGFGRSHEKNKGKETSRGHYSNTLMDAQCQIMRCVSLFNSRYACRTYARYALAEIVSRSQSPYYVASFVTAWTEMQQSLLHGL